MIHTISHQETHFLTIFWDVKTSFRWWHLDLRIAKFTVIHPTDSSIDKHCLSSVRFGSVQLLSCVQPFVTPWTAAHQAALSITNSQSLLKLMSIE